MKNLQARAIKIHETLLKAFGEPIWRNPLPAIDELVSTILSQNTNDINRDRAFDALRAKFPSWESVRDAKTKDVIEAIKPAGLANQKGPRIQQVLKAITEERGSLNLDFLKDMSIEDARNWLTKFNG
ncbi:MAG TPA: Fe-S cluster assembly protein HesB, partial [Anaerolineae bacterium]|nr:Fe-S cluster assembly protein HesB [Anaerolineae bacterium]